MSQSAVKQHSGRFSPWCLNLISFSPERFAWIPVKMQVLSVKENTKPCVVYMYDELKQHLISVFLFLTNYPHSYRLSLYSFASCVYRHHEYSISRDYSNFGFDPKEKVSFYFTQIQSLCSCYLRRSSKRTLMLMSAGQPWV